MNHFPTLLTHKKFNNLLSRKVDKYTLNNKNVSKIEVYNYISRIDTLRLIKLFKRKSFHWTEDSSTFHPIFNIILAQEGEHIANNSILPPWPLPKYYYHVDFARVLIHRGSTFLIKIYRNKCRNKEFSKIEITYGRHKNSYNLSYWDWAGRIKGITEVINMLHKHITPIGFTEDFSWWHDIYKKVSEFINDYEPKKQEKLIKMLS